MLDQKLIHYAKTDIYPFHMPGHKRFCMDEWNPYKMDITEIDGFDNLHAPREILLEVQKKAAQIYGSKTCFYLVNGSTCGILAAISASVKKHGKILVARNCHKAVYNGILLRELEAIYVYPEVTEMGIQGQVTVKSIKEALLENPEIEAVLITSPTYDGIVSDIRGIAEVVHEYGIPLIVDGAHGAHLGFAEGFPENPICQNADIVIESVHKTLPAFTQTALLHVCSERVSEEKLKKYLGIFETSSPSYVLMAGIDRCMEYMEKDGKDALIRLRKNLDKFYQETSGLSNIKIMKRSDLKSEEAYDFDESKILIFSCKKNVSGKDLHQILLEKYHLQMEMVSGQYVLALCSLMDTEEGFLRLARALKEIDKSELLVGKENAAWEKNSVYKKQTQIYPIYEIEDMEKEQADFEKAEGEIAGEYIYLYPPGIPILVPGEKITKEVLQDIKACEKAGLTVEGLPGKNRICIVNFS